MVAQEVCCRHRLAFGLAWRCQRHVRCLPDAVLLIPHKIFEIALFRCVCSVVRLRQYRLNVRSIDDSAMLALGHVLLGCYCAAMQRVAVFAVSAEGITCR